MPWAVDANLGEGSPMIEYLLMGCALATCIVGPIAVYFAYKAKREDQ